MSLSGRARRPVGALILAAACWGVGTAVSKQAVAEIPPLALLPVQLAISLAFLGTVALRRGERPPAGREGRLLGRLGLLNPGLAYALSLAGLTMITASMSVLLWAIEPVLILVLAALLLRERPGWGLVALSAVAIAGLALVLYDPSASGATLGVLLTVAGVGCCAAYTVATRRWLPGADSTLGVVVAQQAHALAFALGLLAVGGLAGLPVLPDRLTAAGVASALASGLVYYGLAYWCYLTGLRSVPASVAAVSFYLIPVFGVGAALLLGERLGPAQWAGAAVVVGAVAAIAVRTADSGAERAGPAGSRELASRL
jgi:probable blue pigment (indigoidine) exporter